MPTYARAAANASARVSTPVAVRAAANTSARAQTPVAVQAPPRADGHRGSAVPAGNKMKNEWIQVSKPKRRRTSSSSSSTPLLALSPRAHSARGPIAVLARRLKPHRRPCAVDKGDVPTRGVHARAARARVPRQPAEQVPCGALPSCAQFLDSADWAPVGPFPPSCTGTGACTSSTRRATFSAASTCLPPHQRTAHGFTSQGTARMTGVSSRARRRSRAIVSRGRTIPARNENVWPTAMLRFSS
ncbi:hypothetical protein FA95DRAFT_606460 [Auriscalpium vulgare]|uniref:Uncharacterized protein n=1 Tax=Auriscalpium vulgare TaxID=40419 RepID=A0ACB8RF58_9AGAM|nr:hypothetical protein FA95DRAFT_606460 [Auriscalpium vulgare]